MAPKTVHTLPEKLDRPPAPFFNDAEKPVLRGGDGRLLSIDDAAFCDTIDWDVAKEAAEVVIIEDDIRPL